MWPRLGGGTEIKLLKYNANYKRRHARLKFEPPDRPMEQTEARALLAKLMARAFDEAPTTPQPQPSKRQKRRKGRE